MVRILRLGCDLVQSLATKADVAPLDRLKEVAFVYAFGMKVAGLV